MKKGICILTALVLLAAAFVSGVLVGRSKAPAQADSAVNSAVSAKTKTQTDNRKSIYYGKQPEDFTYSPRTQDRAVLLAQSIDTPLTGNMGDTYRSMDKYLAFLELAVMDAEQTASIRMYIEEMNELQRDFFSYQMQTTYQGALGVLDRESWSLELWENEIDTQWQTCTKEQAAQFMDTVTQWLQDFGVQDEWKTDTSFCF